MELMSMSGQPAVILCHQFKSDKTLPHEVDVHVRRMVQQLEQMFTTRCAPLNLRCTSHHRQNMNLKSHRNYNYA
eukprot:scaffold148329_cov14-Tisochrysis_lutea.AAC.1